MGAEARTIRMDLSNISDVTYLIVCLLIALGASSGGGGGKRSRLFVAGVA